MKTRQETQKETRATLLRVGEEEVRRIGVQKASLRLITAKAGYSLGAFYSNFSSRETFLLEIFASLMDKLFASLDGMIDVAVTRGKKNALSDIAAWLKQGRKNVLSDLLLEFSTYATHDEAFRLLYTPYINSWHRRIEQSLKRLIDGFGLTPTFPIEVMAAGFSALWQGLTLEAGSTVKDADQSLVIWLSLLLNSAKQPEE